MKSFIIVLVLLVSISGYSKVIELNVDQLYKNDTKELNYKTKIITKIGHEFIIDSKKDSPFKVNAVVKEIEESGAIEFNAKVSIEEDGKWKVIARPIIRTIYNEKAEMSVGSDTGYYNLKMVAKIK